MRCDRLGAEWRHYQRSAAAAHKLRKSPDLFARTRSERKRFTMWLRCYYHRETVRSGLYATLRDIKRLRKVMSVDRTAEQQKEVNRLFALIPADLAASMHKTVKEGK